MYHEHPPSEVRKSSTDPSTTRTSNSESIDISLPKQESSHTDPRRRTACPSRSHVCLPAKNSSLWTFNPDGFPKRRPRAFPLGCDHQPMPPRTHWMAPEQWARLKRGENCGLCADIHLEVNKFSFLVAKLEWSYVRLARPCRPGRVSGPSYLCDGQCGLSHWRGEQV